MFGFKRAELDDDSNTDPHEVDLPDLSKVRWADVSDVEVCCHSASLQPKHLTLTTSAQALYEEDNPTVGHHLSNIVEHDTYSRRMVFTAHCSQV